jgi:hypothetical protein
VEKKAKILAGLAMAVEGMKVASDLINTIQGRIPEVRDRAVDFAGDVRDNAADVASRLADNVGKKWNRGPSTTTRVLQFAAGFGAGFGVALLFAPMPGSEVRENLYRMVSRSGADAGRSGSQSEPPMEERYGA